MSQHGETTAEDRRLYAPTDHPWNDPPDAEDAAEADAAHRLRVLVGLGHRCSVCAVTVPTLATLDASGRCADCAP